MIPANVDIHNVEILKNAQDVDPMGDRTVGIITKPDLVDKGAEQAAIDLLGNQTIKLKLGYHVVKGRGQKDLNENKTIAEGIDNESVYFDTTAPWSSVSRDSKGIKSLQVKLVKLLEKLIRDSLPSVQAEVRKERAKTEKKLTGVG